MGPQVPHAVLSVNTYISSISEYRILDGEMQRCYMRLLADVKSGAKKSRKVDVTKVGYKAGNLEKKTI